MQITVDKAKIAAVQQEVAAVLNGKNFHTPEVMFGLAEIIGRTLVSQTGGTIIEKLEVLKHLTDHAERTVRIGCIANGGR